MLDINYFAVKQYQDKLIFTPKELICDIIFDNTSHIIPFSNGKVYLVYQDLTFEISDALEQYNTSVNIDFSLKIPQIIISNIKKDHKNILHISSKTINNYINKKFSLI